MFNIILLCVDENTSSPHITEYQFSMTQTNQFAQPNIPFTSGKNDELLVNINELYDLCFSNFLPGTTFHGDPTKILQTLNSILNNCNQIQLKNCGPNKILSCCVKILFLCDEDFYKSYKICEFQRNKNYKTGQLCYDKILKIFIPKQMIQMLNIVIQVIHQEAFWQWEDLCHDLIHGLVNNGIDQYNVVHYLLDEAEVTEINFQDARLIIHVLNISILESYSWPNTNETMITIKRFLKLLRCGIDTSTNLNMRNKFLNEGIQLCLRKMITHLSDDHSHFIIYQLCSWIIEDNMNEETILELSSILEYTANIRKTNLLKHTLTNNLFILIMKMIASTSALISLIGNRVLQYLIDRSKNRSQFESPQIFFENTQYNININHHNDSDKELLKQHRELLHDTFVECLMKHSSIRLNLECIYCTICLVAVEVSCGFTAAALVCLIMNVQDSTLHHPDMNRENSNHIHSTVMAIMTLICWIHRAKVLYSYVNQVMMKRAQWAPHLNPPLKTHYSFAVHHILWNKPDHFFVDWEVRFGLWKCFRLHADKVNNKSIIIKNTLKKN